MVTWRIESGPLSKVGKTAINVVSRIFPTLLFLSLIFVGFRIDKNDPKIFVAYVALAVNTVILLANIWHSAVRHERQNLHKVGQNTAYRNILRDGEPYFFSNDLPSGKFYENTSKKLWANGALPYKATIVFPIQHVRSAKGAGAIQQSTRGFLCVDANIINTYRGGYDTELVAIVADALFPVLEELQALQDNERAEQQASLAAASG